MALMKHLCTNQVKLTVVGGHGHNLDHANEKFLRLPDIRERAVLPILVTK